MAGDHHLVARLCTANEPRQLPLCFADRNSHGIASVDSSRGPKYGPLHGLHQARPEIDGVLQPNRLTDSDGERDSIDDPPNGRRVERDGMTFGETDGYPIAKRRWSISTNQGGLALISLQFLHGSMTSVATS